MTLKVMPFCLLGLFMPFFPQTILRASGPLRAADPLTLANADLAALVPAGPAHFPLGCSSRHGRFHNTWEKLLTVLDQVPHMPNVLQSGSRKYRGFTIIART